MAVVAPFKGLIYNTKKVGDISRLVAPPYDVISEVEQDAYYQNDPYNCIRLILGKKKTGDSDWDNRYTRSADHFERWLSGDILIRADQPSIYVTSLAYDPKNGRNPRKRWGLIALVRIEDEGTGVILPHERTFSAHKDDRLKLMRACNAQFSQVFALFEDSENHVFHSLETALHEEPLFSFDFKDGTNHQMWMIQDPDMITSVSRAMAPKALFIADGHHRYETARNFRNIMRTRYGRRPPNRSYEFVMMSLTNMEDEGLTILPSHRLITKVNDFRIESFLNKLRPWFEVDTLPYSESRRTFDCRTLSDVLEERGRSQPTFGFHTRMSNRFYLFTRKPGMGEEFFNQLHPSLIKLDVLILSRLILQQALGFKKEDLDNEKIFHYHSNLREVISLVDSGPYQMAFLLNPTKMGQVKEVAGNGLIMPRKSTFFFPKILTGLVFNKIDPHETIQTA